MKIIAGAMLVVIDLCLPVPILPFFCRLLIVLRADQLADALIALGELERLERRAEKFESCSPEEAQQEWIFEIRLELVACASSIRRLTREISEREAEDADAVDCDDVSLSDLEQDLTDFHRLVSQRAKIERIDADVTQETLVSMLRRDVEEAEVRFEEAFVSYSA